MCPDTECYNFHLNQTHTHNKIYFKNHYHLIIYKYTHWLLYCKSFFTLQIVVSTAQWAKVAQQIIMHYSIKCNLKQKTPKINS